MADGRAGAATCPKLGNGKKTENDSEGSTVSSRRNQLIRIAVISETSGLLTGSDHGGCVSVCQSVRRAGNNIVSTLCAEMANRSHAI